MLHHQVQQDVVELRAMIPAIAAGEVHAVGVRLRPTIGAAIDLKAGAFEMAKRRGPPQPSGRSGGQEPRERCHPIRSQCLQGAPESLIMAGVGVARWRQPPVSGVVVKNHRAHVEVVVHNASAMEDHGLDGVPDRHTSPLGVVRRPWVDDAATTAFVEHASDQAEMVQHVATVRGVVEPNTLLRW
jgi:hypothetical protein